MVTLSTLAGIGVSLYIPYHVLVLYIHMYAIATCKAPAWQAKQFLKDMRPEKMDKPCVIVTALQKCGSTLLSYIVALVGAHTCLW